MVNGAGVGGGGGGGVVVVPDAVVNDQTGPFVVPDAFLATICQ
jgi:hypothetical protein